MVQRCCSPPTNHSVTAPLADRVVSMGGGRVTGEEPGGRRVTLTALPATEPDSAGGVGATNVA